MNSNQAPQSETVTLFRDSRFNMNVIYLGREVLYYGNDHDFYQGCHGDKMSKVLAESYGYKNGHESMISALCRVCSDILGTDGVVQRVEAMLSNARPSESDLERLPRSTKIRFSRDEGRFLRVEGETTS